MIMILRKFKILITKSVINIGMYKIQYQNIRTYEKDIKSTTDDQTSKSMSGSRTFTSHTGILQSIIRQPLLLVLVLLKSRNFYLKLYIYCTYAPRMSIFEPESATL